MSCKTRLLGILSLALLGACGQGASSTGSDPFQSEERGGRLHNIDLASVSPETLLEAAVSDTGGDLQGLSMSDFTVGSTTTETTPAGIKLVHVRFDQQVNGIPVWKAYLNVTASDSGNAPSRLLASSYRVFHGVRAPTTPDIDEAAARNLARTALRASAGAPVTDSKLVLWPLEGRLDLVWSVMVEGSYYRALVYATGPLEGRVIRIDTRHFETTGTVTGQVAIGGAPDGKGVATELPLAATDVTSDAASATTGIDGTYAIDVAAGTTLTAKLAGPAVSVVDQDGLVTEASGEAAAVTDLALGDASNPLSVAGVTAYFSANEIHQFMVDNGFDDPNLLGLTANVNINDACNAFYTGKTLNFFKAGSVSGFTCNNSAERSIVEHEYGHFIDDMFGGIQDGGLSEGWGDLLSCFVRKDPNIGGDLFAGDASALRTCDNDYQYPAGGNDEVHNLGQAWAGFGWHAREGLMAALGEEEGDALARALIVPSLASNAPDIESAVREVFIRDDDDGDLENHTPHWDILLAAAEAHHLGFVVDTDLVAPSETTDLAASEVTATTVTLTWTAAGDDADEGTADHFDLRVSSDPITETNFAQATPIAAPTPLEAGSAQTATVLAAPGETVFFALRTVDEQNNASKISNVVEVTTDEGTEVFNDGFENGGDDWTASGLWHVTEKRAADGSKSFWYGQEDTGNYDTGAANKGDIVSPPIDLTGAENPALAFDAFFDVEAGAAFDKMTVTVTDVNDETVSGQFVEQRGNSGGAFVSTFLGLQGFEGRTVKVTFSFDTVDNVANTTEGWFVDNVRVVADGAAPKQSLIINEVLADPGTFDANGDGHVSFREDEFIELVNTGSSAIDMSGATIEDNIRVRFTFPEGVSIEPGGVLVVFGGGTPPAGMPALIANGLFLNNRGDHLTVRAPGGATLAEMSYGNEGSHDESLTREIDGDGSSAFVRHHVVSDAPASPGTKADGSPFEPPVTPASLVINEVLADPADGFDANLDGNASIFEDEFIEIVNIGGESIDLSGAHFADAVEVRATIPDGTVLEAGGVLVLFGGGSPSQADFPGVHLATANGSLFLNNSGDSISLSAADGTVLTALSYEGVENQSLVRETELDPEAPLVPHTDVSSDIASPGTRADGTPLL